MFLWSAKEMQYMLHLSNIIYSHRAATVKAGMQEHGTERGTAIRCKVRPMMNARAIADNYHGLTTHVDKSQKTEVTDSTEQPTSDY